MIITPQESVKRNKAFKELLPHGTSHFPCAGYEMTCTDSMEDSIAWHWHEEFEIIRIRKGTMKLMIPSNQFLVSEGQLAILNGNVLHFASGDPYMELESFVFSPRFIAADPESQIATGYVTPLLACSAFSCVILEELSHFTQAFAALQQESFGYEFTVREHLSQIMLNVYRIYEDQILKPDTSVNTDTIRLETMLEYIHEHFSEPLTLAEIAAASGISERECLRCFKRTIRESPIQYLIKYRLAQAVELMEQIPGENITNIATRCGFDSPSYFSKCFRRFYLCSPREYAGRFRR